MQLAECKSKQEYENLLPLVNVVFLLLIFFMVAGAFTAPEPFVIEPVIAETKDTAEVKVLTIIMDSDGALAVDNKIMSIEQIISIVKNNIDQQSLKKVQLKTDANTDAIRMIELLEQLSSTELQTVHVLTTAKI